MAGYRILLVDDEEELVTTLVERLRWRGLEASAVTSGDAALELLRREPFDVAVIDLKMPGMDGLALRDLIQAEFPRIRVMLATGHGRDASGESAEDIADQDVLMKPFDIDVLVERINQPSQG